MGTLILLRGLPGSGKSTLAKNLAGGSGSAHFEADQYFMNGGKYEFNANLLYAAHKWCREQVEYAMEYGHKGAPEKFPLDTIVVSNTFTREWEMKPYYVLAKKYGYRVHSLIVENRHGGINEHNVPIETIEKMKDRFEIKL